MAYRFASKSDASRIAELHYNVRNKLDVGFFSKTDLFFLKSYYRTLLNTPCYFVLCYCDDEDGKVLGFSSGVFDVEKHLEVLNKRKVRFALSLLTSILKNPSLISDIWKRYKAVNGEAESTYQVDRGARSEYWVWDIADKKKGIKSVQLLNKFYEIYYILGYKEVAFEVDDINHNMIRFHVLNGAEVMGEKLLDDGRKRSFLKYNLKEKFAKK